MTIRRTCTLRASVRRVLRLRTSGLRYFNGMLTSVQAAAITDESSSPCFPLIVSARFVNSRQSTGEGCPPCGGADAYG